MIKRSDGMLSVNIAVLKAGTHELTLNPSAADIEVSPDVFREVQVDLKLDRRPDRVFVTFEASATARLQCDRTLVDFDQRVSGRHEVLFAPPEMAETKDDDDVRPLLPDDEEIDITDVVRDTLLLAIPQRKVAPGAEEIDIPTRFGVAEEETERIDPRWAALRALRDDAGRDE